jgi:hypothetical protein
MNLRHSESHNMPPQGQKRPYVFLRGLLDEGNHIIGILVAIKKYNFSTSKIRVF